MCKQANTDFKKSILKNNMFNRIISIICILAMLSGSLCSIETFAYTGDTNSPIELISDFADDALISYTHTAGNPEEAQNKSIYLKDATDDVLVSNEPEPFVMPGAPEPESGYTEFSKFSITPLASTYTYAELSNMSNEDVVNAIVTLGWRNAVTDSYTYNAGAIAFYSDASRREALLNAIVERGSNYTATNRQAVDDLVIIMRAGWYLASQNYANNQLAFLMGESYRNEALPAIKAIMRNPNFKPGTQNNIILETGNFISNIGTCDAELVNLAIPFIQAYINDVDDVDNWYEYSDEGIRVPHGQGNPTPWGGNSSKASAFYNIINQIHNVINRATNIEPWKGKVDGFVKKIEELTYYRAQTKVFSLSVENCMWWMQAFGKVHSNDEEALRVLTKAMKEQPYAGVLWFRAATIITGWLNEQFDYDGNPMPNANQQKQIGIDTLLSEKYAFDNGAIVIYAGDKIDSENIERLYWATKEVSAQFFRGVGSDKPIDGYGNVDDVLTCYVYNDLFDYQANKFIFGTSIDNGGVYIESWGSFFTFDRAPGTNLYMLEELFRHEYTHYLQGRYVVPFTAFGQGPVAQNERIDWYQEGGAEWHAGSTRTQGIVPRQSMVNDLKKFPKSNWYSLSKTLSSGYSSGWDFYTYGFGLYSYMFSEKMDMYYDITVSIKEARSNTTGFDNLIAEYKSNTALNTGFQSHMDMLVANVNNYFIPKVSDDYLIEHDVIKIDDVIEEIQGVIFVEDFEMVVYHSEEFNTVKLKGEYKISDYESKGRLEDHKKMDDILDNVLIKLSEGGWTGYKTFVGYYTDYNVNEQNEVEFNVTFHGILTDDDPALSNKPPVVKVNGPFNVAEVLGGTEIQFSSEGTKDDGGIEALTYHWDFGDGNTSTDPNPTHIYTDSGRFDVVLKVTDEHGKEGQATTYVNIKGLFIRSEEEDNYGTNSTGFDKANGPIGNNLSVKGELTSGDVDSFYFNVLETGDVKITLTGEDGNPFSVTANLYGPDSTTSQVETWFNGTKTFNNLAPGKYYLFFYDSNVGKYTLLVTGALEGMPENNILPTAEANGPYEGEVGQEISFSSLGSKDEDGTIVSYHWNFGDGATSTEANPKHVYTEEGTYTATLMVTDDKGGKGTDTAIVTVIEEQQQENNPPVAEANGPYEGEVGREISFSSLGSKDEDGTIVSYHWNFGDGATSTEANPKHAYTVAGTYTAILTVTDDKEEKGTDTAIVTVTEKPVVVKSVTVGTQIGELVEGTEGEVIFPVTTINIVSSTAIKLISDEDGIVLKTTKIGDRNTELIIGIDSTVANGQYVLTIEVDGITSNSFILFVGEEPAVVKQQYTVIYKANGGNGTMENGTVYEGERYTISSNNFTYSGYRFTGWNTQPDGNGISYNNNEIIDDVNSDITLYAQWRRIRTTNPKPDPEKKPDTDIEDNKNNMEIDNPDEKDTNDVQKSNFIDVEKHWAKDSIEYVVERGIFNGTSKDTFSPDAAMTRGMFVTVLGRLSGVDISMYSEGRFNDVDADKYYASYVEWAAEKGIVKGISNTEFAPNSLITREQMAVMIVNYIRAMGYDLPELNIIDDFADTEKISAWAAEAIEILVQSNVINGKQNDLFDPQGKATRAEASVILHRFLVLINK